MLLIRADLGKSLAGKAKVKPETEFVYTIYILLYILWVLCLDAYSS